MATPRKFKITDKASGRSFVITGSEPPSEDQVRNLISTLPGREQKAQVRSFDRLPNEDEDDVSRITSRQNALRSFGEELQYNPWTDEKLNVFGKLKNAALKLPVTGLKAYNAAMQTGESALAAPGYAIGHGAMPWSKEYWKTLGDAVSGKTPLEVGDVLRSALPEGPDWAAAPASLALLSRVPGLGGGSFTKPRTALAAKGAAAKEAASYSLGKGVSKLIGSMPEEAYDYGVKTGWKGAFSKLTPEQAAKGMRSTIDDWSTKLTKLSKANSNRFEQALDMYGDSVVKLKPGIEKNVSGIMHDAAKELIDDGIIAYMPSGRKAFKAIQKNSMVQSLVDDLNAMAGKSEMSTKLLYGIKRRMDSLSKSAQQMQGIKPRGYDAARSAAMRLSRDIKNEVLSQVKPLAQVNEKYKRMARLIDGIAKEGVPSPIKQLERKGMSMAAPADLFYGLKPQVKESLRYSGQAIPTTRRSLKALDEAAFLETIRHGFGGKSPSFGMIAAGASNPFMAAAGAAATAVTSPKLTAQMHRINALLYSKTHTPGWKAARELMGRGLIDPGMARGVRETQGMMQ